MKFFIEPENVKSIEKVFDGIDLTVSSFLEPKIYPSDFELGKRAKDNDNMPRLNKMKEINRSNVNIYERELVKEEIEENNKNKLFEFDFTINHKLHPIYFKSFDFIYF